ncbi:zinc finger protein 184-like [Esox lucius]|uniref:C2H2-type domain-containing protein n=1 Tax=Esox lucius TaxID=8010 RepID=A0A3P8XTP0_ESOLU|nr:zinc finger protein 184-like [Esox lucius]
MERNAGFVNLFQARVKGVLDILLDVAVLEITHIFRGTLSNVIIQEVGASRVSQNDGDQCNLQEVLTCRLKNSLEKAIWTHGKTAETTTHRSVAAAVPVGEIGGDLDVPLKDETCDMNWNVVEIGISEEIVDRLQDGMPHNEEHRVLLFTGTTCEPSTPSGFREPHCTQSEFTGTTCEPSTPSGFREPHCTQSEFTGTTSVSPCSDDISPLTSASEQLTEKGLRAATTSNPHPVHIKQEEIEQLQCSSVRLLDGQLEKLQPVSLVEKIETTSVAVSIPVDMAEQPRNPVHHPEALTVCNNPSTAMEEEPRNPETLELKEMGKLHRVATGPSALQNIVNLITTPQPNMPSLTQQNHVHMPTRSSTLQEPVITQENHVHTASQTSILSNPPPDKKQRDFLLGGLSFPNTNVHFHELQKLLKPCSVRLENVQRIGKVVGNGCQGLRICWDCGKIFYRKRKLRHHQRLIHTGEKPYCCSQCDRTFSLRTNLTKHQRIHSGEKPYGCKLCGKHFRVNGKLKVHMRFHTGEKPFGCTLCGKRYRSMKNFKIHMTTTHPHANLPPAQRLKN